MSLVGVAEGQEQEDNVFVSDLPFAEASSYNDLSSAEVGNPEVRLEGSEAVALDLSDVSLEPGDIYTLFVIGTPTEEAPLEVLSLSSQPSPQGAAPAGVGAAGGTQTGGTMTGGAMTGGAMTGGAGPQVGPQATAQLHDTQGNIVGTASFTPAQDGVQVQVQLTNFPEASRGEHGLHIHQVSQCEPPFESAGDHFNPTGVEHGFLSPGEPHAGDLPNIQLDGDGSANYTFTTGLVTLGQGQRSLNDEDGSALIIHSNPDDYRTNPSGDSGSRIACGVITQGQGEGQ